MNKRHGQNGFSIFEILLVMVMIGVLATLILSTFDGVRRNQRNQERRRDVQDVYQQLEAYNVENGKYPTLANINNSAWRTTNMKTLGNEIFRDPSGKSYILASSPAKNIYAYQVTSADGSACDNLAKPCAHYTLTATLEVGGLGTFVKSSLN